MTRPNHSRRSRAVALLGWIAAFTIAATQSGCGCSKGGGGTNVSTGSGRSNATNVQPPTITSPSSSNFLSNASTLTITGGCTTGNLVHIEEIDAGAVVASQSTTCAGSTYSLSMTPADGMHSYELYQQSVFNGEVLSYVSTRVNLVWTRDTTPPGAPVITSPGSNPYYSAGNSVTIDGSCETGATVYLEGASVQNQVCASSSFSFTYPNTTDGSYVFYLRQVDPAGNGASAPYFTWIREVKPATPFITSPATSPFYTNTSSIVLAGTCTAGYQVNLAGVLASDVSAPAASLTQTCSGSSTFSYTINKGGDG
ncbi:MAG TPA: hypothetical protein VM598_11020, partial [Bdellovibrionota bacterium]|nr:hypothetical protein [Bdellovibrionota bacterium]